VKSLDASAEHLRRLGNGRDVLDLKASLADHLGCSARGKEPDIGLLEALSQVQQACLVIDGDDSFTGLVLPCVGVGGVTHQSFGHSC
jgi:hypothetical protein